MGGNGHSDNFIAALNGDIYFYSPEQLDGAKGTLGQQNLYDYRGGEVKYVTTFNTGPVVRIQVSPDDSHMAFLTASQITSYDNAGHTEMYTYDPETEVTRCVSCIPDGASPTSNVEASDNGLFMTNDGRTFFSTADPLEIQDTDGIRDVYEFVDGRPYLISSGTGSREFGIRVGSPSDLAEAGLIGVSANGTDVYFSTYDTLVAKDRNGSSLKFYDARTDGGFSEPPPPAPCAAADECAEPGSAPESAPEEGTGADLGTLGNFGKTHRHLHPKKKHHRRNSHRRARHTRHSDRSGRRSESLPSQLRWLLLDRQVAPRVAIAVVSVVAVLFVTIAPDSTQASSEFGPSVPGVSTGNAFPASQTGSAIIHGRVNNGINEGYTSCSFEYGTDTTYNLGSVPCVEEEGPFNA